MKNKPPILVLVGPTAVGKTAVAIKLSNIFNAHIINADSMQVYKGFDIGTAKPSIEERSVAKHHMIDFLEPHEPFDAAIFAEIASKKIIELADNKIFSIVAGGTGLYVKALTYGLVKLTKISPLIKKNLSEKLRLHGLTVLHNELKSIDPVIAHKIHHNDQFRILRALEVYYATGRSLTSFHNEHAFKDTPFKTLYIGLEIERKELYERINNRVDKMMASGFYDEVKGLINSGISTSSKPMQSLGYRQLTACLKGEISLDHAIELIKKDTRHYAKRQITWFKAIKNIYWFSPEKMEDIIDNVKRFRKNEE